MTRAASSRPERLAALHAAAKERILVLDGSWGVMLQQERLSEEQFRGERFAGHNRPLKGDNDLLCLTQPQIISGLHDRYYAAGADFASTNSFTADAGSSAIYAVADPYNREDLDVNAAGGAVDITNGAIGQYSYGFAADANNELIHFGRRPPPHNPALPFPVNEDMRNEFDLRMPRLIGVNEMTTNGHGGSKPAKRCPNEVVIAEQFVKARDDGDVGLGRDLPKRIRIKRIACGEIDIRQTH